ncbi:MAG: hypothetical protein ACI8WM_000316 [Burkholderiaceae bacterium]|jgi:hypothetical protein
MGEQMETGASLAELTMENRIATLLDEVIR